MAGNGCDASIELYGAYANVQSVISQASTVASSQLGAMASAVAGVSSAANGAISALSSSFSPGNINIGSASVTVPSFSGSYEFTPLEIPSVLERSDPANYEYDAGDLPNVSYNSPPTAPSLRIGSPPTNNFGDNVPTYEGPFESKAPLPETIVLDAPVLANDIEVAKQVVPEVEIPSSLPEKPSISGPGTVPGVAVSSPADPTMVTIIPVLFGEGAPTIEPVTLGEPGFTVYQPSLGEPGFTVYQPSLSDPKPVYIPPAVASETLYFGTAPQFKGLHLPSVDGLTSPSAYSPETVLLSEPDASAILATFDATVRARPGDPNLSFMPPDYEWVLNRLNISPPDAPEITVGDVDVGQAVSLIEGLIDDALDRPDLFYTPIDLEITPLGEPPDLSGIQQAAAALKEFIPRWKTLVDQSRNDLLNSTDEHLSHQALAPVITAIKERVGGFLSADEDRMGLPIAVENAMRDRAFAGVDKESFKLERQAVEEWLARGFTIPAGPLNAQLTGVRQLAADKRNELSQGIFIETSKIKLENLWNAIKTGIDYEFKYREESFKAQEIALNCLDAQVKAYNAVIMAMSDSAKMTLEIWKSYIQLDELRAKIVQVRADAEKTINEGKIAIYQADASVIATRAGTIGELVKANLAQVDIEKARAGALTELYKAEGSIYGAQMDANAKLISLPSLEADLEKTRLGAVSDEYKAKMDGWKTQLQVLPDAVKVELAKVDISKTRVDNERLKVEASELSVRGFAAEVEAAKVGISGETAKVQAFQAEVEGYKARVSGESTKVQVFQSKVDLEKARVTASQADVQGYLGQVDVEKAKVTASQTQMQGYMGQVDVEKAKVTASQTQMQGYLGQVDVEKAKVQIGQAQVQGYQAEAQIKSAQADIEKTKAQIFQADVQRYQAGVELESTKVNEHKVGVDEQRVLVESESLKVQTYQHEASIYASQINVEEIKVKGKDIELRGEGFKIDNNKLILAKYENDVQFQKVRTDYFNGQVQAYAAAVQEIVAQNGAFKAEVEGFAAQMQGYAEQVKGYTAEVQGESAKAQMFSAEMETYGHSVRGYTAQVQGYSAKVSAESGVHQAKLQALGQQLQASAAFVDKQVQNNRNLLLQYEVDAKAFLESIETAKISGQFEIAKMNADVQNQIKTMQISEQANQLQITKASEIARVLISAMDGVARAHGQAAAGAMGMVNVGATLSTGISQTVSSSCSEEYKYEM